MDENVYFRSEFQYDLPAHKEFNRATMYSMGLSGVMNCLSALCVVYLIRATVTRLAMILLLVLGIVCLGTDLMRWYRNRDGGVSYKQILHKNGGNPPHQIVTLAEDGIHGHNPRTENEIFDPYENFRSILETKNLLILVTDLKMCHIIDKRSLTGGSRDEVIAFLRSRCPKLKKSIKTGRFGLISRYLLWGIVTLGVILALANLLHIPEKLSGQITGNMSYQEMAEELLPLGIEVSPIAIEEMEKYTSDNQTHLLIDTPTRILDLLCWEGQGRFEEIEFAPDAYYLNWNPSESGVYWFDLEVFNMATIYSDFLRGVAAMDENLTFSNVSEDYSGADIEAGRGKIDFSFDYLDQHHELEAEYNYDWFDTDILYDLGRILAADDAPEDLWMIFDGGQGVLLYYGTQEEVRALETKTGLTFLDCATMRMGH